MFFQPDIPTLREIYDSLSGEGIADFEQTGFYANDLFLKSIAGRVGCWLLNDTAEPCGGSLPLKSGENALSSSGGWRTWMNGYSGSGLDEGNVKVGSADASFNTRGFVAGLDRQVSQDAMLGFAVGYNFSAVDVPERETKGSIHSWCISGYGAFRHENFYLRGTLAFELMDNKEYRHAFIPNAYYDAVDGDHFVIYGSDNHIATPFKTSLWSGDFEFGYNSRAGDYVLTPFAGVQFGFWHLNGFSETDVARKKSSIGLTYHDRTITSLPARIGMQLTKHTALSSDSALLLSLRTAWVHEFYPERTLESSFNAAPGFNNIIRGAQPYDNVLETSIGLDFCSHNAVTLYGRFGLNILKPTENYSGLLGLQVSF